MAQGVELAHGGIVLARDLAPVAQERAQGLHRRGLHGAALVRVLDAVGAEQVVEDLAPPAGRRASRATAPGSRPRPRRARRGRRRRQAASKVASCVAELLGVLVRQQEEGPPGEAVADAVERGAALAGLGCGASGAGAVEAGGFGLGGRGSGRHRAAPGWADAQIVAQNLRHRQGLCTYRLAAPAVAR